MSNTKLFISETEHGTSFAEIGERGEITAVLVLNDGTVTNETWSLEDCAYAHNGHYLDVDKYLDWSPTWDETTSDVDRNFFLLCLFCIKEDISNIDDTNAAFPVDDGVVFDLSGIARCNGGDFYSVNVKPDDNKQE